MAHSGRASRERPKEWTLKPDHLSKYYLFPPPRYVFGDTSPFHLKILQPIRLLAQGVVRMHVNYTTRVPTAVLEA